MSARPVGLAGLAVVAALLAGCTGSSEPAASASPSASPSTSAAPAPAPAAETCTDATVSYAPSTSTSGPAVAAVKQRGRLVVGVSGDTRLFGATNPLKAGAPIEGFDIDVVKAISTALFGSPDKVTYKVITAADRISQLQSGGVDIVARNMTMTCARWEDIAFSAVYYQAGQKLLVPVDSKATRIQDLADGSRVCAPKGSTSIANLAKFPNVRPVEAERSTDCLVRFQQGAADAITGDDVILAGFVDQDRAGAKVVGDPFSKEPYGLGIKKENVDLVRFVNSVLADWTADGGWVASYRTWLQPSLKGGVPAPPKPQYGRR